MVRKFVVQIFIDHRGLDDNVVAIYQGRNNTARIQRQIVRAFLLPGEKVQLNTVEGDPLLRQSQANFLRAGGNCVVIQDG